MLGRELGDFRRIKGYLPQVFIIHLNAQLELEIYQEIEKVARKLGRAFHIAREADMVVL